MYQTQILTIRKKAIFKFFEDDLLCLKLLTEQAVQFAFVASQHQVVFFILAGLVGHGAAGLASRLAGRLAFATATMGKGLL